MSRWYRHSPSAARSKIIAPSSLHIRDSWLSAPTTTRKDGFSENLIRTGRNCTCWESARDTVKSVRSMKSPCSADSAKNLREISPQVEGETLDLQFPRFHAVHPAPVRHVRLGPPIHVKYSY